MSLQRAALALLAAIALAAVVGAGVSGASFTTKSANPGTRITAAADWAPPTVSLTDPGPALRGSVTLSATAADTGGTGVAAVRIQRSLADAGSWTDVCTATAAPYNCTLDTTKLANDVYDLRAVATDNAGFATASDVVAGVDFDNASPTVSVTDPGSSLHGIVTVQADASDADSGVASVRIQRSASGAGNWSDLCTDASAPYSCRWDTTAGTTPDGSYDLRAVALDVAGNSTTSNTVANRRVDNSVSSVSLDDPGEYLRGAVTLTANAASSTGVKSVAIQRSPAGAAKWTTICAPAASPWSCPFDTTAGATPDGLYDFRAVLTTGAGAVVNSATVANRHIDNTAVRGADVQAFNRAGGTAGRLESGDSLTLAWTDLMNPLTLLPNWTGATPATVYARLRDGAALGTGSGSDWLQLTANSAGSQASGLGTINLGGDYVRSNKIVTFTSTATLGTASLSGSQATQVTVTLGTSSGGGTRRTGALATMAWSPAAAATDLAGNPSSSAPVSESGTADRDF
jgi:Big-like domain-containing protein